MTTSPDHSSHAIGNIALESAVPTLKVMRLQSPDLHQPTAGTFDTRCLLGTAMCLPDSFGVIHVGETFTAYLGALNASKDFPVRRLTVTAQLQTPHQRWALPSALDIGNQSGGVDVPPDRGVDAIVSHALEEAGQHILRVEVSYAAGDGGTKTMRKFYRFNVSNPLNIRELTMRGGDSSCFVSIAVENASTGPFGALTISSVDFHPAMGLSAERIGETPSTAKQDQSGRIRATDLYDQCGRLESGASIRYLFLVKASSREATLRGIAGGDELGKAVVTWRKAMGEAGRIASSPVICPLAKPRLDGVDPTASRHFVVHGSGLSVDVAALAANRSSSSSSQDPKSLDRMLPVTVEPIDPPTGLILAVPQEVQFLIVNHSSRPMSLQLQFRLNQMTGVAVCGQSFKNLGEVAPNGGSCIMGVRFVALVAGLLGVQGCYVVDLATAQEIAQPPLFSVFVQSELPQ